MEQLKAAGRSLYRRVTGTSAQVAVGMITITRTGPTPDRLDDL